MSVCYFFRQAATAVAMACPTGYNELTSRMSTALKAAHVLQMRKDEGQQSNFPNRVIYTAKKFETYLSALH